MSEELSAENTPTICLVIPRLYNINCVLNSIAVKNPCPVTKAFARTLIKLLEDRFPKCGSENYHYAAATIVHPYYQGMALYELGTHQATTAQFVQENEDQSDKDDLNAAQVLDDFEEDDMSIEAATQRARAQRLGAAGVNCK